MPTDPFSFQCPHCAGDLDLRHLLAPRPEGPGDEPPGAVGPHPIEGSGPRAQIVTKEEARVLLDNLSTLSEAARKILGPPDVGRPELPDFLTHLQGAPGPWDAQRFQDSIRTLEALNQKVRDIAAAQLGTGRARLRLVPTDGRWFSHPPGSLSEAAGALAHLLAPSSPGPEGSGGEGMP